MILPFAFFIWMSKNGNSFKLFSIVNFILGCRFWFYSTLLSLFNLCEDKFTIFGIMLISFLYRFFYIGFFLSVFS